MLQTVAIELLVVSLFTILMTLFISHKIAGPLYRLKENLKALGNGHLKTMHLRQGDQLQEIAVSYNDTIGKLNAKIKAIKESSSPEEAKKILDTFKLS
jgi:methyl-accepting chemotaxis protein